MRKLLTIICLSTLLAACGADIAYKRGANHRDYQVSKAACTEAKTETELKACLEEKGWAVQKLDKIALSDDELFATASYEDDNRTTKPKPLIETTEDIANETAPTTEISTEMTAQADAVVEAESSPANTVDTSTKKPYYQTLPGPAKSTKPSPRTIAKAQRQPSKKSKPAPNMLDTYVIKSWWKMGGNLTMLEGHMNECSADLGEAHYPNKKTFTFTRGFAICMRQHGWRGLVEK